MYEHRYSSGKDGTVWELWPLSIERSGGGLILAGNDPTEKWLQDEEMTSNDFAYWYGSDWYNMVSEVNSMIQLIYRLKDHSYLT